MDSRQERLEQAARRLDRLAWLLDDSFGLPGTKRRFGIDPLLGLIPGVGDVIGAGLSLWLLVEAARLGASRALLTRMFGNVLVEALIGIVPVVGDVFDFYWKANQRNRQLLATYIDAELHIPPPQPVRVAVIFVILMVSLVLIAVLYSQGAAA